MHFELSGFAELAQRGKAYREATPFPHIVAKNTFPDNMLHAVNRELDELEISAEKNFYGSYRKHRLSDLDKMPPSTRHFIEALNSPAFLRLLEILTGIPDLMPDPYLEGGGVHQIGAGGYLKIHTDFNWHRRLQLHRRVNLLIYLNEGWREEWNGQLELWNEDMSTCSVRVAPDFNNLVVFTTTDRSYHGHPDPLACPEDVSRRSIALYYYTKERPDSDVKFGRSELTNYQARPGEGFADKKHWMHQILLKHPNIREIIKRVTGK